MQAILREGAPSGQGGLAWTDPMPQNKVVYILAGVIVASLAGAFLLTRSSRENTAVVPSAVSEGDRYFCDQCRKEFVLKLGDYAKMTIDEKVAARDMTATRRPHCPLCGARHSGWMMVRCPTCGTYHLPAGLPGGGKCVRCQGGQGP